MFLLGWFCPESPCFAFPTVVLRTSFFAPPTFVGEKEGTLVELRHGRKQQKATLGAYLLGCLLLFSKRFKKQCQLGSDCAVRGCRSGQTGRTQKPVEASCGLVPTRVRISSPAFLCKRNEQRRQLTTSFKLQANSCPSYATSASSLSSSGVQKGLTLLSVLQTLTGVKFHPVCVLL